jgi:hypothetical protein
MKTIKRYGILMVISIVIFTVSTKAQTLQYSYDKNGNSVKRKLYVTPCNNCAPPNQRTAATPVDTAQSISLEHGLNVFPNPTQDKVNLTLSNLKDGEITEVIVTDMSGKTLYFQKNLQSQNEINMASFNNGNYFLRVTMGNDVRVYKVMKIQ